MAAFLSSTKQDEMKYHRQMLLEVLDCIRFLLRQGLPLSCHYEDDESLEGNLPPETPLS